MIIQYAYFDRQGIMDQEDPSVIEGVPQEDVIYLNTEEYLNSHDLSMLIPYFSKYTDTFPVLKTPDTENEYSAYLYFTIEEYAELKKNQNSYFNNGIYCSLDRLAIDDEGNLYDIPEEEPKTFRWYIHKIVYIKEVTE